MTGNTKMHPSLYIVSRGNKFILWYTEIVEVQLIF